MTSFPSPPVSVWSSAGVGGKHQYDGPIITLLLCRWGKAWRVKICICKVRSVRVARYELWDVGCGMLRCKGCLIAENERTWAQNVSRELLLEGGALRGSTRCTDTHTHARYM
jgi:hypothetical protein